VPGVSARHVIALTAVALLALLAVSVAGADRRATRDERRAIAKVLELPRKCTKARIPTVTPEPKWAAASWKPHPAEKCAPYAADGVVVLKYKRNHWKFVTAGSSFDCSDLYRDVPKTVVDDLGIDCV
jgi:hypothetical protein